MKKVALLLTLIVPLMMAQTTTAPTVSTTVEQFAQDAALAAVHSQNAATYTKLKQDYNICLIQHQVDASVQCSVPVIGDAQPIDDLTIAFETGATAQSIAAAFLNLSTAINMLDAQNGAYLPAVQQVSTQEANDVAALKQRATADEAIIAHQGAQITALNQLVTYLCGSKGVHCPATVVP